MDSMQTPEKKTNQCLQPTAPPVISTYAIDQGIYLFKTNFYTLFAETESSSNPSSIGHKYSQILFAQTFEKEFGTEFAPKQSLIDLSQYIVIIKEQIDSLSTLIQDSDFKEAMNWFKEAWTALSGKNIELFKNCVSKSYDKSMAAITRIQSNPCNLLGAYSVKIFCGFCIFSNYGENILLGLQHINDTLNELNNHSLLDKSLYNIVSSNIFWKYHQREFVTNVVRFSVSVRSFVKNIIDYSHSDKTNKGDKESLNNQQQQQQPQKPQPQPQNEIEQMEQIEIANDNNENENENENGNEDEGKDNDENNDDKMDEVDLDENQDINNCEYEYGDIIKQLFPTAKIDKDNATNLQNKQLLEFKKWCPNIFNGKYFGGCWAKEYVQVDFLYYLYPMIFDKNNMEERKFMEIYDEDLGKYLATDNVVYYVKPCIKDGICEINLGLRSQSYVALSLAMHDKICKIKEEYLPNEMVIRAWAKIYDKILISSYFTFKSIIFDRVDESVLLRFCYLIKNQRGNHKLLSLTKLTIKQVAMKLSTLNVLFLTLNDVCVELEELILDSILIKYKNNKQDKLVYGDEEKQDEEKSVNIMDEILFLQYLPQSITCLIFENVAYKSMDNVYDTKGCDVVFGANIEEKENDLKMNLKNIMFLNTKLSEANIKVLFCDFIGNQCDKLESIAFKDCGLRDNALGIVKEFYNKNGNHKLTLLDFTTNNNKDTRNIITSSGIEQIQEMFENTLKERKDVKVRLNVTTVEICANMGQSCWNSV